VIKTVNLSKVYHSDFIDLPAIYDVNLEIKEQEFIAITGPSGAGKSTLLHILACLDTPTSGSYFLNGVDVSHLTKVELASIRNHQIGYVFQDSLLIEHLNALENVALPMIYSGMDEKKSNARAHELLKNLGLERRSYFYPEQLSGGQQQRVAIARALAMDAKLLLADEPTGNLDTENAQLMMDLFLKLNREKGTTVIIVTHELSLAEQAQRIIFIRDGKKLD